MIFLKKISLFFAHIPANCLGNIFWFYSGNEYKTALVKDLNNFAFK